MALLHASKYIQKYFEIDVTICPDCHGPLKIVACIEDKQLIDKILTHVNSKTNPVDLLAQRQSRGPPADMFA